MMVKNNYKELTFANNFIFAKVMQNKELCKKLLEVILGIKISKIEYVKDEVSLAEKPDSKSVRLDVIDDELKSFLTYLADGIASDGFTQELADEVEKVKANKALEVDYMTLYMLEQEKYEEGLAEGLRKGLLDTLANLVRDGLLSVSDAASRADMSEEAFKSLMN